MGHHRPERLNPFKILFKASPHLLDLAKHTVSIDERSGSAVECEIEGLTIRTSMDSRHCVVSLKKTLYIHSTLTW